MQALVIACPILRNMEPAGDPGHNGGQAVVGGRSVGQRNGRGQAPLLRGGRGPRLRGVGERGRGQAPLLIGGGGPRLRGVGERVRGQGHGPRRRQQQHRVSNEIRAIVVDHVINHGMTMTEAMIQPNLRRSTVASIIRTFCNENR